MYKKVIAEKFIYAQDNDMVVCVDFHSNEGWFSRARFVPEVSIYDDYLEIYGNDGEISLIFLLDLDGSIKYEEEINEYHIEKASGEIIITF